MKSKFKNIKKNKVQICTSFWSVLVLIIIIAACKAPESDPPVDNTTLTAQFEKLHNELSTRYAFSDWKAIDWDAKYQTFQPRIAQAESNNDNESYYLTLREYVHSIPDGHVWLGTSSDTGTTLYNDVRLQEIGGSYGFILAGLDDGSIVFSVLSEGGPAAKAGIKFGAEIVKWNGQPIAQALNQVPLFWAPAGLATKEIRRLYSYYFLDRAAVGTTASITFINPTNVKNALTAQVTVELEAVNDNYQTWYPFLNFFQVDTSNRLVEYSILPEGYGYVKITAETLDTITQFETAMEFFNSNNVKGIIMDLRDNSGGRDQVAADICGYFYDQEAHYEDIYYRNATTGEFESSSTINIEPRSPYFGGQIIVMVGPYCISSGEGPAKYLKNLPNGEVVSLYGSNGSFGMSGAQVSMPMGLTVNYANGQSRDENLVIQIDGNANGKGGVLPDKRVPLNLETLHNAIIESRDIELEFVILRMKNLLN